ncbi:hypothetical protein LXL04_005499 [Taraxacum kok-saghyz]
MVVSPFQNRIGDGEQVYVKRCTNCHSTDRIYWNLRLNGIAGNRPAATPRPEFTAGERLGVEKCSGKRRQRLKPTASRRRCFIRFSVTKQKILELDRIVKMDLKQKARIKWVIDGDENSRFFHGMVNNKARRNMIHGLNINGVWCSDPTIMKKGVRDFFSRKFHEKWPTRPKLLSPLFKRFHPNQMHSLKKPFDAYEIKVAISDCGSEKASGPDDFTLKLFKLK